MGGADILGAAAIRLSDVNLWPIAIRVDEGDAGRRPGRVVGAAQESDKRPRAAAIRVGDVDGAARIAVTLAGARRNKQKLLAVWRPGRLASALRIVGQLDHIRAVGIHQKHLGLAGALADKGDPAQAAPGGRVARRRHRGRRGLGRLAGRRGRARRHGRAGGPAGPRPRCDNGRGYHRRGRWRGGRGGLDDGYHGICRRGQCWCCRRPRRERAPDE